VGSCLSVLKVFLSPPENNKPVVDEVILQMKDKNACVMKDLSNIINNDKGTELPHFFP